jgi:hypothetical protein
MQGFATRPFWEGIASQLRIGEIGITGTPAAIANAVFHATGRRIRQVPIRPEHFLG